ncbi:hypothetical protein BB558_003007 [Smittium angustum]|uniref:Uncharacterized protein n=1 Tax=Smittium angustum TaxID=133377 RepID=A0A2U1J785_SMIAN|nr:hypothetical protein BB558_003007 [Smittium angustum]
MDDNIEIVTLYFNDRAILKDSNQPGATPVRCTISRGYDLDRTRCDNNYLDYKNKDVVKIGCLELHSNVFGNSISIIISLQIV